MQKTARRFAGWCPIAGQGWPQDQGQISMPGGKLSPAQIAVSRVGLRDSLGGSIPFASADC